MPYFLIEDFSQGLDARKSAATLPPGSLRYANNVHVTRGGELEKRKAFVPAVNLPPGSVGLSSDRDYLVVYSGVPYPGGGSGTHSINWINAGAPVDYLLDTARWANAVMSALRMQDGTNKLMFDTNPVSAWNYSGEKPVALETFRGKVYGVEGSNFYGSALYDPNTWDAAATGSFVVDTAMQSQFMSKLNAVCVFQGSLVLLSEDGIQVWEVDPDPAKNYLAKSLTNSGCVAPRSVLNFGNFDTVFLSKSGIRSLQARQNSDLLNVQDIGTPVDDFISELVAQATIEQVRRYCVSVVEPEGARLWIAIGDLIMVHSYYQGSKVSAWTTYTPGFRIDGMTVLNGRVFVRSGDVIYIYGGDDDATYDASLAEVWTPYHHAQKPATMKAFTGFDIGCEGEWSVSVAADPRRTDFSEFVGRVVDTTFAEPNQALEIYSTHLSLVLSSSQAARVRLFDAAMHYTEGESA